jgi:predicted RNase H-like HicB family nuclease
MRTVVVVYHHEEGQWWAESPEPGLEGFVVGGPTLDEARHRAQDGLEFYLDEGRIRIDERFDSSSIVTLLDVRDTTWAVSISAPTERATRAVIQSHPAPVRLPRSVRPA